MDDHNKTKDALIQELNELRKYFWLQVQERTAELTEANAKLQYEISGRMKLEQELRDNEERYRSIFDNSLDGIMFTAPEGEIFAVNPAACAMLQKSEREVCEEGRRGILDETDTRLAQALEQRDHSGRFIGELNHKRKDGSIFPVEFSSTLFKTSTGDLRSTVIIRDITERKRAEQELKGREEEYHRIFENQLIAIGVCDLEALRFLDINKTLERIYGYSREELMNGMTLFDLTAEPEATRQAVQQATSEGDFHVSIRYHKKKDRAIFPVEISMERHSFKGQAVLFLMARDITERIRAEDALRNSEQRLDLALKATQDAVWDLDISKNEMYVSPRWLEMVGYEYNELKKDSELLYRLMHPEDLMRAYRLINEALAERTSFELEARLRHKQGHYIPVLSRGFILRSKDNAPVRMSGINSDLTERKRIEEERSQLEKLEGLNRMAAAIAHTFNNLLGAVIGNLDLAIGNINGVSPLQQAISEAMTAAHRAAEVSSLMLTYLGKSLVERKPVDLSHACQAIWPAFRISLHQDIALETDLPSTGPFIIANEKQIQEMLRSLVSNASEAIGKKRGAIHLRVRAASLEEIPAEKRNPVDWRPQGVSYACLEVMDTGCGIAEKDMGQIFDPFFSTKFQGRGLGLAVVLGIVRTNQGVVAVESVPGKGSAFRIFFPLAQSNAG